VVVALAAAKMSFDDLGIVFASEAGFEGVFAGLFFDTSGFTAFFFSVFGPFAIVDGPNEWKELERQARHLRPK